MDTKAMTPERRRVLDQHRREILTMQQANPLQMIYDRNRVMVRTPDMVLLNAHVEITRAGLRSQDFVTKDGRVRVATVHVGQSARHAFSYMTIEKDGRLVRKSLNAALVYRYVEHHIRKHMTGAGNE